MPLGRSGNIRLTCDTTPRATDTEVMNMTDTTTIAVSRETKEDLDSYAKLSHGTTDVPYDHLLGELANQTLQNTSNRKIALLHAEELAENSNELPDEAGAVLKTVLEKYRDLPDGPSDDEQATDAREQLEKRVRRNLGLEDEE